MFKIFEEVDKSERTIYLTKERWSHIQKHSGMSDKIEEIKQTLKQPDKINEFEYGSGVKFYYKYYKERKDYLFISVKYLNGKGFIITSFFTDKIK